MIAYLEPGAEDSGEDLVALARQMVTGARQAISRTNKAIAQLSAASRAMPGTSPAQDCHFSPWSATGFKGAEPFCPPEG